MTEFASLFSPLEDPRSSNARRHSLHDIISWQSPLELCSAAARPEPIWNFSANAKWELLQSFLKLENGIPSHDTFSRLLGMLDPAAFRQWFIGFMRQFTEGGRDAGVLAVDGKTLRRSCDQPCRAVLPAASGQHPGRGAAAGLGATGRGREIQRDCGTAQAAGNADFAGQSDRHPSTGWCD